MNSETFNYAERSGFIERLGRLAGQTTWREPTGAGYTAHVSGALSPENAMVLALSLARRYPGDVGPDIAYSVGTGQPHRRGHVAAWLADKLLAGTGSAGHRAKRQLLSISGQAYDLVIGSIGRISPPSHAVPEFEVLANIGAGWLWIAMEAAVERAEVALYSRLDADAKQRGLLSRGVIG